MNIAHALSCTLLASLIQPALAAPANHQLSVLTGTATASSSQLEEYNTHVKSKGGDALMLAYNAFAGFKDNDVHLYYEFLFAQTDVAPALNIHGNSRHVTLDSTHLHIGGTYEWQTAKYFHPYFGMTFGRSNIESTTGQNDHFWGFSAALGFNVPLGKYLAVRADARAFLMRWDSDTALLCAVSETPCEINLTDNSWLHPQLTLGATLRF